MGVLRKINEMFHVDAGGFLVKTSNDERIPEDEPVFILRGRDVLAGRTINYYAGQMIETGCDHRRIFELGGVFAEFMKFSSKHPDRMKQPGSTRGK